MNTTPFKVAAFYSFTNLSNLTQLQEVITEFLKKRDIKGTVLLASEGINGTLAGHELSIDEFKNFHPKFDEDVYGDLKPLNVVKSRNSEGGTGFVQVEKEVNNWQKRLLL